MKRPRWRRDRSRSLHAMSAAEHNAGRDGALLMLGGGQTTIGDHVTLDTGPEQSHIFVAADARLVVGDSVVFGQGAAIAVMDQLEVGAQSSIGAFCMIADTDFHAVDDHHQAPVPRPIKIGERVSIGPWTVILPGTTIEDDVVVQAASVVSGTVSAGSIVGGVPARPLNTGDQPATLPSIVQTLFGLDHEPALAETTRSVKGWDSLGALRVLMAIEDILEVRINETELTGLETIGDWVDLVARTQGSAGPVSAGRASSAPQADHEPT